jgi:prolipoprotein diacylglyceryl transferase
VSLATIPSPTQSVWHLGPLPIRAYALCIILGIVAACVVTEIRMRRRGAPPSMVLDIAVWAVPAGIIGARIYHVLTSPGPYFGADGDPVKALYIWEGGLGIWGAVAGGAVGAWIACRRLGIPLTFVADCLAPGLPLAQAIGRWGNWFNNELYGKPTDLPWALKIYEFDTGAGKAVDTATGEPAVVGQFHPAFLYESVWDLGVALAVWLLDRRYRFGRGRAFALYVMLYAIGRFWVELLRTDEASELMGMRLNNWTAVIVFLGALVYFVRVSGPQERLIVDEDGNVRVADDTTVTPVTDAVPTPTDESAQTGGAAAGAAAADAAAADATDPPGEGGAADGGGTDPPVEPVELAKSPPANGGDSEPAESRPGTS